MAKRKQELGLASRETYVPQSYEWGSEAQVDWYEAWADLSGERAKHRCSRCPARDIEELSRDLLTGCREDQKRQISGKPMLVGSAMMAEGEHLLPLPDPRFDLAEVSFRWWTVWDACVYGRTHTRPLKAGRQVQAKLYSTYVEIWHEGQCLARHERCCSRQQQILALEHYLDFRELAASVRMNEASPISERNRVPEFAGPRSGRPAAVGRSRIC